MGRGFKYSVGDIYLDTEFCDDNSQKMNYVLKQIIARHEVSQGEMVYESKYWSKVYDEENTVWDSEHDVEVGKILLDNYLKGRC